MAPSVRRQRVKSPSLMLHLPSSVPGGNSLNNLIELKTINISPTDTTVSLLSDCTEVSGGRGPSPCLHLLTMVGSGLVPRRRPARVPLLPVSAVSCSQGVPAQGESSHRGPPCYAESVVSCNCSALSSPVVDSHVCSVWSTEGYSRLLPRCLVRGALSRGLWPCNGSLVPRVCATNIESPASQPDLPLAGGLQDVGKDAP